MIRCMNEPDQLRMCISPPMRLLYHSMNFAIFKVFHIIHVILKCMSLFLNNFAPERNCLLIITWYVASCMCHVRTFSATLLRLWARWLACFLVLGCHNKHLSFSRAEASWCAFNICHNLQHVPRGLRWGFLGRHCRNAKYGNVQERWRRERCYLYSYVQIRTSTGTWQYSYVQYGAAARFPL